MPDTDSKFDMMVRAGYFSRALLYIVLGLIALGTIGQISEGTDGIFATVSQLPGGTALLWILVVGLACYALFRLASPVFDIEHNGSDWKGWAQRIGHAGSAVGHLALAWTAYKFATNTESGGESSASQAAGGVLSLELGGVIVGLLGVVFFLAAFAQASKAITASFMARISPAAPDQTRWMGRAGYATRAVVFGVTAWSLIETGFMAEGAGNVKTLGEAVGALAGTGWLYTVFAIGLLMFGLFSLVLARYAIVPDFDADGRVPKFRKG
ncbi:DUF1206 domain-containing protein [Erythrobacter sp. R86502]|uniref:DUF1206 domain-containing protein n=1 Tax=Erythrobacter sp. R86502 TaxID=3093846 RepID=UPI0036D3C588